MLLAVLAGLTLAHAEPDSVDRARAVIAERLGEAVSPDELDRAAVAGMAALLDEELGTEGNAVLTRAEQAAAEAWMAGERSGIGVEYRVLGGRGLVLTTVFEGGPGAMAGLHVDDLVVGMNGTAFTGQPAHEIHRHLQQAVGAEVALDVRRRQGMVRSVRVPRGTYRVPSVMGAEDAMQPVVRLTFFGEGTAEALSAELELLDPGMGVVLDLRDNEGGRLSEVVAASELFLDEGLVVVHEQSSRGGEREHSARSGPRFGGPVVILVNRGTLGAAEAFARALQYHRAARVVGTTTGGQGTLTSTHSLGGDLVLRLTDIQLAAPDGRSWHGVGVRPDLVVEAPSLSLPPLDRPFADSDLQREAALGLLRDASSP